MRIQYDITYLPNGVSIVQTIDVDSGPVDGGPVDNGPVEAETVPEIPVSTPEPKLKFLPPNIRQLKQSGGGSGATDDQRPGGEPSGATDDQRPGGGGGGSSRPIVILGAVVIGGRVSVGG